MSTSEDIILVKLSSSEEIIARVVESDEDCMVLSKARSIIPTERGAIMLPWALGAQDSETEFESNIKLKKVAIIGETVDPPKALVDRYLSNTSGIQIATGK